MQRRYGAVTCRPMFGILVLLAMLLPVSVSAASMPPLLHIRAEIGDGSAVFTWNVAADAPESARVAGVKIYRLRQGTEQGYRKPPALLVKDAGRDTSCEVTGLQNGEQYMFLLKAYDAAGKEFWQQGLIVYPGSFPAGAPAVPGEVYGATGDGRAALFWKKNTERDLKGYEVQRQCRGEDQFRTVAKIPKIVRVVQKEQVAGKEQGFVQFVYPGLSIDTNVRNGVSCSYRVRAFDGEGKESAFSSPVEVTPTARTALKPEELLLLVNERMSGSRQVAEYYARKRGVPESNILALSIPADLGKLDYARDIQVPVQKFLLQRGLAGTITCIVPCYGMPIRGAGRAVDSKLADLFDRFTWGNTMGTPNPYFDKGSRFDGTYGMYLVTRIDGPSVAHAKGLVDKALLAEKSLFAVSGTAYLASGEPYDNIGNKALDEARKQAEQRGIPVVFRKGTFAEHELKDDALWYFAWRHPFKDPVDGEWRVGAVGAHLISDSFFKIRDKWGTSWVQGLLAKGITGTFGAVIEPYLQAYTRSDIFFKNFWSGDYTFAESFTMATPTVQWAMSAVGDPLYRLRKGHPDQQPSTETNRK